MKAMTSKTIEISRAFESLNLTADAVQLIKDIIVHGYWGDSDFTFNGETKHGDGYVTNDGSEGGHFAGKQISGIMSGVAKAIEKQGCSFMASETDWWGNDSGDVLAFSSDFASHEELVEWATAPKEKKVVFGSVEIALPEQTSNIRHLLADDSTARKYMSKAVIMEQMNLLLDAYRQAGREIEDEMVEDIRKLHVPDMVKKFISLWNTAVQVNERIKERLEKSARKSARKTSTGRITDAEERFTRYSEELAKREAGETFGLDAKGQKHRIASLKRKIARAEKALTKIQKNS